MYSNQAAKMTANLFMRNALAIDVSVADDEARDGSAFVVYVGTGGDVEVVPDAQAAAVVFKNVPDGTWLPVFVTEVKNANTTASDMLACWG